MSPTAIDFTFALRETALVRKNAGVRGMWVVSKRALRRFWEFHPEAKPALEAWYQVVAQAEWKNFADVRAVFNSVDIYRQCYIFNVAGNKYRIIAAIHFNTQKAFIRNVLTHAEYDKEKWKAGCEA